jgi:RNA polymerase sigma factor (sigma-70 family)
MTSSGPIVSRDLRELLRKGSLGSLAVQELTDRTDPVLAAVILWEVEARDEASKTPPPASTEAKPASTGTVPRKAATALSDSEIVRKALNASTAQERVEAFEAIAERYRLTILRQCARWFPDPEAAQDVAQSAFEGAFTLLTQGEGPSCRDQLGAWLIEIARQRARAHMRAAVTAGVPRAVSSGNETPEGFDDLEDDQEYRSGSAVRRAHATRLVEAVVATLTERQQQIYQLRFVQELTGRQISARLGIGAKAASNEATIVQGLIADGFGALVLSQEGRAYCPDLARIIDTTPGTGPPGTFSAVLRHRIVNHLSYSDIGDRCRICNIKRRELAAPYAP